jgi:hypothetical protein
MQKSDLLHWLQAAYQRWEASLDRIGSSFLEQPGVNGEWSMKDMIAHLTGWNRWLVTRLLAAQRGDPDPAPPWPAHLQTEDEINAWIYASSRDRTLREVRDETRQVFEQLFAVINSLPADVRIERVEPAYYLIWIGDERFLASEFFDHFHDDHEADVRAWLASVATA